MTIAILKEGLHAPNATLSQAGWSALCVTALVAVGLPALSGSYADLAPLVQVAVGTAVQLVATLVFAGLAMRTEGA